MYCIDPVIFSYLNKNIENNIRSGGLIQFTDALEQLRQEHELQGLVVNGDRFNIGNPTSYLAALAAMSGGKALPQQAPMAQPAPPVTATPVDVVEMVKVLAEARTALEEERTALAKEREEIAKEREFVRASRLRLERIAPSLVL